MSSRDRQKNGRNVSLTTRIAVAFVAVTLIPIIMIAVLLQLPMSSRLRTLGESYGINNLSYSGMYNNSNLIASTSYQELDRLKQAVLSDPGMLQDPEKLSAFSRSLENPDSFILILEDGRLLFNGSELEDSELLSILESGGSTLTEENGWLMIHQEMQSLFAGTSVKTDNQKTVSLYVVSDMNQIWPGVRRWLFDLLFLCVFVLLAAALIMGIWLYSSTVTPLNQLKKAAQNIRDGNLDFKVGTKGVTEICEVCEDFEEMRKRLKESAEEKLAIDKGNKELLSNISHDLKTPITAIRGYCEGILDGVASTPEKVDKYVRTIYNKANEMDTLINELTFYSRIDTNRIPYTFTKVRIGEFFDDCADELRLEMDSKGVDFTYKNNIAEKDTVVIGDTEQLKRVIHNIISNSLKYMDKPEKTVQIRLLDQDDFVQAAIEDNGRGIANSDLPLIFDRFYRTDASRSSSKGGSGIGLSIVKKIMEDHGGKVWATSTLGEGTTMHLLFRKYREQQVPETEEAEETRKRRSSDKAV